MAWRK
jgi:L-asparaginase